MKYWVIKIFWFFANSIRKIYWFIFRPQTRGAKCLIEFNDKFLLVRLNYAHRNWTLPGGKVNKNESFQDAAIREAKEETGIDVVETVFIGGYKNNTVEVYLGHSRDMVYKIDPIEIKEAGWFSRNELPNDRVPSIDEVFKFYDEYKSVKN